MTTAANGANVEQAKQLARAFQKRCPVFTTLARAAPIKILLTMLSNDPPDMGALDSHRKDACLLMKGTRSRRVMSGVASNAVYGCIMFSWRSDGIQP
jgi:hypothetical protein